MMRQERRCEEEMKTPYLGGILMRLYAGGILKGLIDGRCSRLNYLFGTTARCLKHLEAGAALRDMGEKRVRS